MTLPLSLPRPAAVLDLAGRAAGRAVEVAGAALALPARALALLSAVELAVARITVLVDRVERLVGRVDAVVDGAAEAVSEVRTLHAVTAQAVAEAGRVAGLAEQAITGAHRVTAQASAVVGRAGQAAAAAGDLLSAYEPALRGAAPMLRRFVGQLSEDEVTAAIRLVDELPKLTSHLTSNVLPILNTLHRVGPDVHDLLEVTRDLKLAIAGIPGLSMLRRRGEDRLAEREPDAGQ